MRRTFFHFTLVAAASVAASVSAQEWPDSYFPLLSNGYANAYTVRACVADKSCPVPAQALFPCGTPEDAAAARICAMVKDGRRTVSPYRVVPQGRQEGGNCGAWFLVTCFDPLEAGPPPGERPLESSAKAR